MGLDGQNSPHFSRRAWLTGAGSAFLLAGSPIGAQARAAKPDSAPAEAEDESCDLLIKGGKVIDPSQDIEELRDVAIRGGKVVRLERDLPAGQARQVVDASGKIVTPGLIDLHTHVFPYVSPIGIEADPYCVRRGATTALDAGTSGAFTFPAFRKFIIPQAATRIRALLHVVSIGLVTGTTPNMGELIDLRYCDPKLAVQTAEENRDLIVGFKIRLSEGCAGANDLEGLKRARVAADHARLPLMAHIAGPHSPLAPLLALMKQGDVVTHAFNSAPHGILDAAGKVAPEVQEARRRGVLFDIGHGSGSFSFDIAEKCLHQEFLPDTISSDLWSGNVEGPVYDLATTLSKFLLLGMSLKETIARATVNAARTFNFGVEIGTLKPGAEADVAVFDLRDGEFTFTDSNRKTRTGRQMLRPVVTVRGGKLIYPTAG